MNVSQLIELLATLDPTAQVEVDVANDGHVWHGIVDGSWYDDGVLSIQAKLTEYRDVQAELDDESAAEWDEEDEDEVTA